MNTYTHKPTCFISGCSGYIGSYIAKILTKQNWQVWGVSRNQENKIKYPEVNWIIGDLLDLPHLQSLLENVAENTVLDAVIHCAGDSPDFSILNLDSHNFDRGVSLNFLSVQKINQCLLKRLHKGSSIIHFGSRVANHGNIGQISYGAAKGILVDYTKVLAAALGPLGITVNLVLPGVHPSQMLGKFKEQIIENAKNESLLNSLTNIEDVANAVLFLLKANSVTGQVFAIESRLI